MIDLEAPVVGDDVVTYAQSVNGRRHNMGEAHDSFDCPRCPLDLWCEECTDPAYGMIETSTGKHSLCRCHLAIRAFKVGSKNWNGARA